MVGLAWRSVRGHPGRFALSLAAVVLGVAFVSGTLTVRAMMAETFASLAASAKTADVYVQRVGPDVPETGSRVDDTLAALIQPLPQVHLAWPDYSGAVMLMTADGEPASAGLGPSPRLRAVAGDPVVDGDLADGRLPSGPGEVALGETTATMAGLAVGDRTDIVVDEGRWSVEVTGVLELPGEEAGVGVVLMDVETIRQFCCADGLVVSIAVYGTAGVAPEELKTAVETVLPADDAVGATLGGAVRDAERTRLDSSFGFIGLVVLALALAALLVGAFIIANTFSLVVREQLRSMALLRTMGASPRQVTATVVLQAVVVGLAGSVLGLGAGFAFVWAVRAGLGTLGMTFGDRIPIRWPSLLGALALGIGTTVAAAWVPSRRAARCRPVDALFERPPDAATARWARSAVGACLVVLGAALLGAVWLAPDAGRWLLACAALSLAVGAVMAGPVAVPAAARAFAWPLRRLLPAVSLLARGNIVRAPHRAANTASALMISLALVSATLVVAASSQASVRAVIEAELVADFMVVPTSRMPIASALVDDVTALPEAQLLIERILPARVESAEATAAADPTAASTITLSVVDSDFFDRVLAATVREGTTSDFPRRIALDQGLADSRGIRAGQEVTVTLEPSSPRATAATAVVAFVFDSTVLTGVFVDSAWLDGAWTADEQNQSLSVGRVFVCLAPTADVSVAADRLNDIVRPYPTAMVLDKEGFRSSVAQQVDQLVSMLFALVALSVIVSLLGVANTLALSIAERKREIGFLRVVGLDQRQLAAMVFVESLFMGLAGALSGLVIGTALGATAPAVLADQGLQTRAIPWGGLALALSGGVVAAEAAALLPARRAIRSPVLEAIAEQ
ncbi:MAG: FtsX-like permease family protein [Propionibacteriaceae bacterium]|jgi:putative ABC transport system permease protein|nr:FtsX-like permease family protein [Propionibacteriaceae bacterium]